MTIKTTYTSIYNRRPDEMYGMGTEDLTISGKHESLEAFMAYLMKNSSIKHSSIHEHIMGTDEYVEREDWKPWLGQPMFFLTDISYEKVDD